ncbi:hypothetical protein BSZ18_01365 [Bradyrhizobium canariense]|uniref:Uncharacterized protein n=1 Tax=Bradyrhizobium canariense TaxID=255045 RepID=A0A1X3HFD9_9BRAD|nr:hypothetical protein BSZ25_01365 [Bradyrhizobium canariense]OSI98820.1 hypothetical protein BSZ24_01270 [Bradyrhizobium canariense]OSJ16096.1 hypothetical protein BSZ16_01365 [Bradyrhizobium canariense]OSJ18930.1 hypothetical protein BSZ18_01365 [Bradyrhizobium canariense]
MSVFRQKVELEYGIKFAGSFTKGMQNKFSFFMDAAQASKDLEIHIGVCPCFLDKKPENLIDPSLPGLSLKAPHPIVIDVDSIAEKVSTRRQIIYSHESAFSEETFPLIESSIRSDYAFSTDDCSVPASMKDRPFSQRIRSLLIRDYALKVSDLNRE